MKCEKVELLFVFECVCARGDGRTRVWGKASKPACCLQFLRSFWIYHSVILKITRVEKLDK